MFKARTAGIYLPSAIALLTLMSTGGFPATYYVSLGGDDKYAGSKPRPWKGIAYACKKLKAGDTLIIQPGDYGVVNGVKLANDGTRGAPIVVKAAKPGAVVFREGTCAFDLTGSHHIIIEGIRFLGYTRHTAVAIGDPASYVTIRRCIFEGNGANGITVWGHSGNLSLVHHLEFYENQFIDTNEVPADQDYGISLNYGMYAYVHQNYVFGRHHQAISFKRKFWNGIAEKNVFEGFRYTALYLGQNLDTSREDNRSRHIIAQWNVFRPARGYRAKTPIWCANVEYAVIRHNYMEGLENVDGGWGAGIHLSDSEKGYKPGNPAHILIYGNLMRRIGGTTNNPGIRALARCTDVRVFHNTLAYCKRGIGAESPERLIFVNNIFYNFERMVYEPKVQNFAFDHNCIYPDWKGKRATDISKDPLFVGPFEPLALKGLNSHFQPDPRADGCKLRKGSPCIDAGAFLTTTVGAGEGKTIRVKDAGWFTDGFSANIPDADWFSGGFNEPQGSLIRIGNSGPLRVAKVDYENNTITVDKPMEWRHGEGVGLYYWGERPDIGPYEYSEKGSFLAGSLETKWKE